MPTPQPIDLSIIDVHEVKKLQEKKKKIQWIMKEISNNGLDKDEEFMQEIDNLIKELLQWEG